jgi:hypothetical protein
MDPHRVSRNPDCCVPVHKLEEFLPQLKVIFLTAKYFAQNFCMLKEITENHCYIWGFVACAVLNGMNVSIFCTVSKLRCSSLKVI